MLTKSVEKSFLIIQLTTKNAIYCDSLSLRAKNIWSSVMTKSRITARRYYEPSKRIFQQILKPRRKISKFQKVAVK